MYEVIVSRDAVKSLERARANPLRGKRLRGELEGLFSLRIGEMRAVYEVDSDQRVMVVHAIGSRGDIYKK